MKAAVKASSQIVQALSQGLNEIRQQAGVASIDEQNRELTDLAATVQIDSHLNPKPVRHDATDIPFVTLDPKTSTDLDQAYSVEQRADKIILYYAIADISAFVERGGDIEKQAWQRGVTVYCPDGSVPLYPRILSSQRASLLPDGPRPAVLLTVEIAPDGRATLLNAQRAMVQSRAKLAYEDTPDTKLTPEVLELSRRIHHAETIRGAFRIDRPEQEVLADPNLPGGLKLEFAQRQSSEDHNAALSLAANLAVGQYFLDAGVGLFRVMDDPSELQMKRLRAQARAFGIDWPPSAALSVLVKQLKPNNPRHCELTLAIGRVGSGARYLAYPVPLQSPDEIKKNSSQAKRPWHSAIAASYAHATAPMRRLADRYVLDLLVAQFAGDQATVEALKPVMLQLPAVMQQAEQRANKIERDSIELIESMLLEPLIGQHLSGTVIEVGQDTWQIQICEPAVLRRLRVEQGAKAQVGDVVQVRVTAAQLNSGAARLTEFFKTTELVLV